MVGRRNWLSRPWAGTCVDYSLPLAQGLVDYWPTNEAAGGSIFSAGAGNLTGTLGSGVTWTNNQAGSALAFSSSAITTTGSSYNWERTQPWSVSFWIFPTTLGASERCFFSTLDPASNFRGWEIGLETNNTLRAFAINSFSANACKASTTTALSVNTVYHIAVTYTGGSTSSSFTFYINGLQIATTSSGIDSLSGTIVSAIPLRFGNRSNGTTPYAGQMWDAGIWNRVLSSDEIRSLYGTPWQMFKARQRFVQVGAPPSVTGPVLFYNHYLNQGWR